jgi:carboxyl-terminal processing protease
MKRTKKKALTDEYFKPDSSIFVDSLKYKTRNGRTVYGGGGIMPDVFVAGDTSGTSLYLSELQWNGVFNAFAFDYLNQNNIDLKLQDFLKTFEVNEQLLNKFTLFAAKEFKVRFQRNEFLHSKENIKRLLKAEIARHLYLENGYYQVVNTHDTDIQRALKSF